MKLLHEAVACCAFEVESW